MKNTQIKKYLDTLSILSQSTEDYLFLLDIENDENWFFGDISRNYAICDKGIPSNTTADLIEITHPNDREALRKDLQKIADGKSKEHNMSYRWIDRDGKSVWINCRGQVIDDADGNPMVMIGRVSDTFFRHAVNPLTGLFNKDKLLKDVKELFSSNISGYFVLMGVDNLSEINLKHGRPFGDSILLRLAGLLERFSSTSEIYHVEGDLFALSLRDASPSDVEAFFGKIQDNIQTEFTVTAVAVPYIKTYFIDEANLYASAEQALFHAKNERRGALTFFSQEAAEKNLAALDLLEEMDKSVKNGCEGFYLCYQPQIKSDKYTLYGVEALLRYNSKKRGKVFPNEFIPLLEQSGLIKKVGMWVLKTALNQARLWRQSIPDLHVSVNFSIEQLEDDTVVDAVLAALKEAGVPGKALTIEFTETMQLQELPHFNEMLKTWKTAGIEISVDDFGTGYSNLGYLKYTHFDEIKIDRLFVSGLEEETYSYILISNIIEFAKANSIRVCCEGIETEKELSVLSVLSPTLYQGYLFDKPCEVDAFEKQYIDPATEEYNNRIKLIERLYSNKVANMIRFDPKEILKAIDVGLWIYRIDLKNNHYELHADETMKRLLGVDHKLSPTECYNFWRSRITDEDHANYIENWIKEIAFSHKIVQCQYPFNHPTLGKVISSCSAVRVEDSDGMICIHGLHRILTGIEETKFKEKEQYELRQILQKTQKYTDAILANAMGYMEVNLSQDLIVGDVIEFPDPQHPTPMDLSHLLDAQGNLHYETFLSWWSEHRLVSDPNEYLKKSNCEYLLSCYHKGERTVDVYCSVRGANGATSEYKQTYYLTLDELTWDVTALCVVHDITEEKMRERELERKNAIIQRLSDEFRGISYVNFKKDKVTDYRADDVWAAWDHNDEEMSCYSKRVQKYAKEMVHEDDRQMYLDYMASEHLMNVLKNNPVFAFEYRVVQGDTVLHYNAKIVFDRTTIGSTSAIMGFKNIEKERSLQYRLQQALTLSHTDVVTGLLNQQGLLQKASELLEQSDVNSALLFMDIDNFKMVNDTYGHSTGDQLLVAIGDLLTSETRSCDLVGRYGGDEFIVFLHDIPTKDTGVKVAHRLCKKIRTVSQRLGIDVPISGSIGVAFSSETGSNYRMLKDLADDRLYVAKRSGKDQVVAES